MSSYKRFFDCQHNGIINKKKDIIRGKIFIDESDYINEVRFKVFVPRYLLKIPKVVETQEINISWYDDINPHELVSVYLTIADLIELVDNRVTFKISGTDNILTIFKYLKRYLLALESVKDSTTEHKEYYEKTLLATKCIKDILDRLSKTDKGLQEIIHPKKDIITIISKYNSRK